MRLLALDLGKRHTGVAFGDDVDRFVVALDTIHHASLAEMVSAVEKIVNEKKVQRLIIGLPTLPDGTEGEQALWTRRMMEKLASATGLPVTPVDERFTSKHQGGMSIRDDNALAACTLLNIVLDRAK